MAGDTVLSYSIATSTNLADVLYLIQNSGDKQLSIQTLFGTIPVPIITSERLFLQGTPQVLNDAGNITATQTVTVISNDVNSALTIDNGVNDGQVKILLFASGTYTSTLSGANIFGSITFNIPGQSVILFWHGTTWWKISG